MSKIRCLVTAAYASSAGYGAHSRTILRALRKFEDKIDLVVLPLRFATTSNTYDGDAEELAWFDHLAGKFNPAMLGYFDLTVQIGVPPEWKNFGRCNVGVTAGVETLTVPPEWIGPCNLTSKIITISNFSKQAFLNSADKDGNKVVTPIDVIGYPVRNHKQLPPDAKINKFLDGLPTKFNFLSVNQWAPRKNIEQMLAWFLDEFKTNENVGLVLKLYSKSTSTPDKYECRRRLFDIVSQYPDRKCKIYLLHGDMTDDEIHSLFTHPKINVYLTATHGEGWGLSPFEAAYSGVPIVAPDFSGYKDYLYQEKEDKNGKKKLKPFFQKVNYQLNPIQQQHLMPGILNPGMHWAYPIESDFKFKLREVYKDYGRFKKQAEELKEIVTAKFTEDYIYEQYIVSLLSQFNLDGEDEIIEV